ncbi:MAG TPA: hypothetical protein VEB64_17010 [Azospirillaceae bacterium]|nr:hypothetical protein [Azospirillaceae bacterium]
MPIRRSITRVALGALLWVGLAGPAPAAPDAIRLPDPQTFPEGIAALSDGTLLVGSAKRGAILRVPPGTIEARPFIPAGANGLNWVTGLIVDEARDRLYACSSDPGVSDLKGTTGPAVVVFRASSGAALSRHPMVGDGFCNDMALAPNGDLLVTDSLNPRILRLSSASGELTDWLVSDAFKGEGFNLNGIAFDGAGTLYVVKYNTGDLLRVAVDASGRPGAVTPVALPRPLNGPDGLERLVSGQLVVVEGGTGALTAISLDGDRAALRPLAGGMASPTTVAIHGSDAWVVEGQLDLLFDPKKINAVPDPFRLVRVPLDR